MAKPSTANPITSLSTSRCAFHAASTPSGTARHTATNSVASVSDSVGSRRCRINRLTGRLEKIEVPKSPCSMPSTQSANCSRIGRSRPSLRRTAASCSTVASSPAMMATGSPGASRKRKNTNTATTTMTGMVATSRRRIKAVMCLLARLFPSRCLCPCAWLRCDEGSRQGRQTGAFATSAPSP